MSLHTSRIKFVRSSISCHARPYSSSQVLILSASVCVVYVSKSIYLLQRSRQRRIRRDLQRRARAVDASPRRSIPIVGRFLVLCSALTVRRCRSHWLWLWFWRRLVRVARTGRARRTRHVGRDHHRRVRHASESAHSRTRAAAFRCARRLLGYATRLTYHDPDYNHSGHLESAAHLTAIPNPKLGR
jgi:hypothetical protein